MGEKVDYIELYKLQDKVLKAISNIDNDFYLTGGTALHRFYFNARYSNDLDFFVSSGNNFKEDIDEIIYLLKDSGYVVDFDIMCFAFFEDFNWGEMLGIANNKAVVEKDILIYRIASFPLQWLERIKKLKNIEITKEHIEMLCEDVLNERDNSLKI